MLIMVYFHFAWGSNHTVGQMELFKHMLATPLTVLHQKLAEVGTSHDPTLELLDLQCYTQRMMSTFQLFSNQVITKSQFNFFEVVSAVKNLVGPQVLFVPISTQAAPVLITGNSFLLEEAVLCIIKNALQAARISEQPRVICSYYSTSTTFVLVIRDFGTGMAWWEQLLYVLPYVSSKASGSGIGLTFAKTVIEKLHGGTVTIASQPCRGTEVMCVLPLSQ